MTLTFSSRLLAVAACGALLAGCATHWYKAGATKADFDADKTHCVAEAYQSAPTHTVPVTIGSGYTEPAYTTCTGGYGTANCVTTGGNYVPPTTIPMDANMPARRATFNACMYDRGWSKRKHRHEE
jgi:hypothetical protein